MVSFLSEWTKASIEEQDNYNPELEDGFGNGSKKTSFSTIDPIIVKQL